MHNEKLIKKLLKKCSSNILIGKFFDTHTEKKLNIVDDDGISDMVEYFINHYNSLTDMERIIIVEECTKLVTLLSEESYNIIKSLRSKIDNEYDILAEKTGDKVLAFYINNQDRLEQAVTLAEFYKISNYNRYEGGGKSLDDVEDFAAKLSESLETKILDAGPLLGHSIEVYKYQDMVFVKVTYSNKTSTYYIYNTITKDVLIKNSLKSLKAFDLAALIMLKINNYVMEEKYIDYDMSKFEVSKIDEPFGVGNGLSDWSIKSVRLTTGEDEILFNFKIEEEVKYMSKYLDMAKSLGLDKRGININQVTLQIKLINSKKKYNINVKNNKSNINILKKDHLKIEEILKSTGVHKGWKVKEM